MESTTNRTSVLRAFGMTACLVLALAITGCATTLRGQVVDAQTGQPIPGAVILGVWTKGGGVPGLAHTDLVGVREAETDAEGRFELGGVSGWLLDEKKHHDLQVRVCGLEQSVLVPAPRATTGHASAARNPLEPFPAGEAIGSTCMFIDSAARSSLSVGQLGQVPRRNPTRRRMR